MEPNWTKIGRMAGNPAIGAVRASPDGYGVISAYEEPQDGDVTTRLRGRRSVLVRVTATTIDPTWEGRGTVEVLDGRGLDWGAIIANLKPSGSGSDFTLLRSLDGGKSWEVAGEIPALSIQHLLVVGEHEFWVLGARTLSRSTDGGRSWQPVEAEGSGSMSRRSGVHERLRLDEGAVALLTKGGMTVTADGGQSWTPPIMTDAWVRDVAGDRVLGVWQGGVSGVAKRAASQPYTTLPEGRLPLKLAREGARLRVLSRAADGSKGPETTVHHSADDGATFEHHPLKISHNVDIAGPSFGLGTDMIGGIHVTEGA